MANPIGTALRRLGLYRPIQRTWRTMTMPERRERDREIRADLLRTQEDVGAWAALGADLADPDKRFALLSFTDLPIHAKFQCVLAKTMQLQGYTPVIFTHRGCRHAHAYFRMFGVDNLVIWQDFIEEAVPDPAVVDEIARALLPAAPTLDAILNCQLRGVDVGKHALSVTARKRVEGSLDLKSPETLAQFHTHFRGAVQSVLAADYFLDQQPTASMLVRDAGYIPNGGLFERALARGVDCIVYEQGQRKGSWIFKRYTPETKGRHFFSLASETWAQIQEQPWTPDHDAKLDQLFAGRYRPDSTDDTRRLMTGKAIKPPEVVREQLALDPQKKTAVIFSHIAWDAAFFFGSCLFDDLEDWLFQTVKFVAAECPDLNWIVKLHPFNVFKLQFENKTEESELRLLEALFPLPDHVRIMRANTDINTQSLFPVVDYVLTVNGTVGMEFPCFGVPAVLAGTGRYDGYGFTLDHPTRDAYFETLRRLHTIPRLDEETQRKARQHFYTVIARRQFSMDDIMPMDLKRANEAQTDVHDNVDINARSLDEFRAAPSIRHASDWLAHSTALDLLQPEA
ncbi:MAG: hypothetical protein GYB67_14885 [Chloroflexi bacterium]|nr:hypothetical protein [Chloroflexota bacterium]